MRMMLLDQLGDRQRTMGVGQPMQVDPERGRIDTGDELLRVKLRLFKHAHRQVQDAHA